MASRASMVMVPRFGQEASPPEPVTQPKPESPSWSTTLKNWVKSPFKLVMALVIGFVSMVIATWVERWVNDQLAPLLQGIVQQGQPAATPPKPDKVLPVLDSPIDPAIATALEKRQPLPASFFSDPEAVARQQALLIKSLKTHKRALEHGPRVTGFFLEEGQRQARALGLDSFRDKQGLTLRQWRAALMAQVVYTQLQQAKGMTDPQQAQHLDFWSNVFFEVFRHSGSHGSDKTIGDTLKRFESAAPDKAKVVADATWTLPQFWEHRAKAAEQKALPTPVEGVTDTVNQLLRSTVWPLISDEPAPVGTKRVQFLALPPAAVTQVADHLARQLGTKPLRATTSAMTDSLLARQAETASQLAQKLGAAVWVWDSPLNALPEGMAPKVEATLDKLGQNDRHPVWVLFPQA